MKLNLSDQDTLKYKIIVVDDDSSVIDSLKVYLHNYTVIGVTDPQEAIVKVKNEHFDIMILDYVMTPFYGDHVVEEVRKFDNDLYILLYTAHKDLVPPLETTRRLDIQGYCEKSDNYDQLLLLVESAIKSVDQMNIIKKINKELSESKDLLEKSYLESIEALRTTVEVKDVYTKGHSDRVAEYSLLIGEKLNLSPDELKTLKIGALFHDIGKIGIPDSILLKDTKLSKKEAAQIRKHPSIGEHILSNANIFQNIIPIVKHHHERYDGTGYPSKLSGDNIPLLARIVAVADTFDAMTSRRAYRSAIDFEHAKEEIIKCSGTQFDPVIAKVFVDILTNNSDKISEIQSKYLKF